MKRESIYLQKDFLHSNFMQAEGRNTTGKDIRYKYGYPENLNPDRKK